jgi:hypothetical protein
MKIIVTFFVVLMVNFSFGQNATNTQVDTRLFAQCLFSISTQQEIEALQNEMYNNPNIEMVRLDLNTQRALIITANLQQLSPEELTSWFGNYESTVSCINIGVYGVDAMATYPFTNCQ